MGPTTILRYSFQTCDRVSRHDEMMAGRHWAASAMNVLWLVSTTERERAKLDLFVGILHCRPRRVTADRHKHLREKMGGAYIVKTLFLFLIFFPKKVVVVLSLSFFSPFPPFPIGCLFHLSSEWIVARVNDFNYWRRIPRLPRYPRNAFIWIDSP